jgi:penicillin amidase
VLLTHGRSKIAAWGVTALNPDVTDLFVEYLRGDTYLSKNKAGWEEVKTKKETIKVRFGEDVEMTLMFTRNGVLLPMNLIDGTASDLMPWIHSDLLQHELVNGRDVHYALAHMYDPMVLSRFEDI